MTCPINPGPEVPGRRAEVLINGQHVLIAIPPELDHLVAPDLSRYSIALEDPMIEPTDHNLDVLHQRTASGQKQFTRLVESNDNEGEVWTFWLQLMGNEDELGKLAEVLVAAERATDYPDDYPFQFYPGNVESESVVDKLVEYGTGGYMASNQKVTGTLRLPEDLTADNAEEKLYKGGIKEMFT